MPFVSISLTLISIAIGGFTARHFLKNNKKLYATIICSDKFDTNSINTKYIELNKSNTTNNFHVIDFVNYDDDEIEESSSRWVDKVHDNSPLIKKFDKLVIYNCTDNEEYMYYYYGYDRKRKIKKKQK